MLRFFKHLLIFLALQHLRFWAKIALAISPTTTIGIAGSVGKSSTKQILYAMLRHQTSVTITQGNSETGVPLGILGIPLPSGTPISWLVALIKAPVSIFNLRPYKYLIIEMATDSPDWPKNMDHLLGIVQPNYSIWLNVYPVHTEQFAKAFADQSNPKRISELALEALAAEDGKIITKNPKTIGIYNADSDLIGQQILDYLQQEPLGKLLAFGNQPDTEIKYGAYHISPTGSTFELHIYGQSHTITIDRYLLPQVYQQCLAAALLTGIQLGLAPSDLITSLQNNLRLDPGRSSLFKGIQQSIIIDSTYNASAASVVAFIEMLHQLKQQTGRPVVVMLGDMKEIGPATIQEHQQAAKALGQVADRVYLLGELTKQHVQPWLAEHHPQLPVQWAATSQQLAEQVKFDLPPQSLILAKGSQSEIYLEEAIKPLLADPQDASRLCRQEPYWLRKKEAWIKG